MLIKDRGSALSRQRLVLPLTFPSLAPPLSCAQAGRDARGCDVESPGGCGEAAGGPGGQVAPHVVPSAPDAAGGKELPLCPRHRAVAPGSGGWALSLTHCACACRLQGRGPSAATGKDESVKICHCLLMRRSGAHRRGRETYGLAAPQSLGGVHQGMVGWLVSANGARCRFLQRGPQ